MEYPKTRNIIDIFEYWYGEFSYSLKILKRDTKTESLYNGVIGNFLLFVDTQANLTIDDVNVSFIQEYLNFRDSQWKNEKRNKNNTELSYNTKKNDIKVLKLFFDFIEYESMDNKDLEDIVFDRVRWKRIKFKKDTKTKVHYKAEDIVKYLNYLEKNIRNKRDEISYTLSFIFKLCIYIGLRASEACKVKLNDFGDVRKDNNSNKKLIDITIEGKGSKTERLPIPYDYLKKELSYFRRKYKNSNKKDIQIFYSRTGKLMNRYILYREFENITKHLGLGDKGIHILRHTWSNKLNDLGIDIGDIQILMRHASILTTKVYVTRSEKRIDSAVSKL